MRAQSWGDPAYKIIPRLLLDDRHGILSVFHFSPPSPDFSIIIERTRKRDHVYASPKSLCCTCCFVFRMANIDQTGSILIDSDRDSSYGESDAASETTSLRSAVLSYIYENGRRYHSYRAGSYWGPNDDKAQDNLDLFHHIFNLSLEGRLFLAPIGPDPQRVLDLGMLSQYLVTSLYAII